MIILEVKKPAWLKDQHAKCFLLGSNLGVESCHATEAEARVAKRKIWCSFISEGEIWPTLCPDKAVFVVRT